MPVYPCWRGELSVQALQTWLPGGLSPLTRGTRSPSFHLCLNSRFIPAGAGNSATITTEYGELVVYPRWRGELDRRQIASTSGYGLSPLARGTQARGAGRRWRQRFIPAAAGNSARLVISTQHYSVYPRWRGELPCHFLRRRAFIGLSPLARGTLIDISDEEVYRRFIPAGAGNSIYCAISFALNAVYPRWRGELSKSIHLF